jgi:hypothetical protein
MDNVQKLIFVLMYHRHKVLDLVMIEVIVVFLGLSRQLLGQYLKLGHDSFFPRHFQFTLS